MLISICLLVANCIVRLDCDLQHIAGGDSVVMAACWGCSTCRWDHSTTGLHAGPRAPQQSCLLLCALAHASTFNIVLLTGH